MRYGPTTLRHYLTRFAQRLDMLTPDVASEIDEIALDFEGAFDCHLQRIEQLERRCGELADELSEARDRLNDLDGQKRYNY
jgi:vacuolar-type H+-ATPase subunit D/Vma8